MTKIEKLKIELERAKKKSSEWQARVRDIEKQITDCENTEILQAVRSIAASPEELRGLLDMLRASKEPPQAGPDNNNI
nr:DUF4315 family protein [uncultured Oscillibacter sp.]